MQLEGEKERRGADLWWLLLAWSLSLGLQGLLLGGVRLGSDSHRYQEAARLLIRGLALEGKEAYFPGYNLLLYVIYRLGGADLSLVAVQWVLALVAGLLLWRAADRAWGHPTGLLVGLAFLLWPDLMRWNWYVLTDGPYASLMAACLALAWLVRRQPLWWLALAPALAWLTLLRPEGGLFILPVGIYLALRRRWLGALVLGLAWCWLLWQGGMQDMAGRENVQQHFRQGTYIWGQPILEGGPALPPGQSLTWLMLQGFINDPLWTLGLLGRRWFYFLTQGRPYYSPMHNLWSYCSSLGLWLLAALAWWRQGAAAGRELALPSLALAIQLALVGITWSDYDGRDLARLIPALLLLAGAALARPAKDNLTLS